MAPQLKTKLVIYTVLTGLKEPPGNPLARLDHGGQTDLEIDFICFTDDPGLISPIWTARTLPTCYAVGEKASRLPKALPHRFFPEYEYSLYIDNIVEFKRLPTTADLECPSPYLFKMFKHSGRQDLLSEAQAIVGLGFDDLEPITRQLDHYSQHIELSKITPLSTCTVMLRQHHHPKVKQMGELWWEQILSFSKRDQMSFDFIRLMTDTNICYFTGSTRENDLVFDQSNLGGSRILASFDESKYAYINGLFGASRTEIRRHYRKLNPTLEKSLQYARRNNMLEYHAFMAGSGLGQLISPRRGLANYLEENITSGSEGPGSALAIGLKPESDDEVAWTEEEINRAVQAMAPLMDQLKITLAVFGTEQFKSISQPLSTIERLDDIGILMLFNMSEENYEKLNLLLAGLKIKDNGIVLNFSYENSKVEWIEQTLHNLHQGEIFTQHSSAHSKHDLRPRLLHACTHCIKWSAIKT